MFPPLKVRGVEPHSCFIPAQPPVHIHDSSDSPRVSEFRTGPVLAETETENG